MADKSIALQKPKDTPSPAHGEAHQATVYKILIAISFVHLFNDSIQSVIPAIFPILKDNLLLTFTQIGWISFAINFTSSIIQPVIGYAADRRPTPILLPIGMCFTFAGVFILAYAHTYLLVLFAVVLIGLGSATFHPEGMRVAHMAAGMRKGLSQSIFQVGAMPDSHLLRS